MTIATQILPLTTPREPAEIGRLAERRLRESSYFFLKKLTCHYADGVLTLSGPVPSRQLRQVAESMVCRVPGVEEVVNRIEIVDPADATLSVREVRNAG